MKREISKLKRIKTYQKHKSKAIFTGDDDKNLIMFKKVPC